MDNNKTKALKVFGNELFAISNPDIKDFVLEVFDKLTPDYFWTCPASTSGKYHPQISLGQGGLIRHTKLAVWWGIELSRAFNMGTKEIDYIIASLLLHDLRKNGESLDFRGYPTMSDATKRHGGVLAQMIVDLNISIDQMAKDIIIQSIAGHMGVWTGSEFQKDVFLNTQDSLARTINTIVHLADYAASRKVDSKSEELTTA